MWHLSSHGHYHHTGTYVTSIITRARTWHLSSHGHVRDIYHPTGMYVTSIITRARMWHLSSHGHVRDIYHPTGTYVTSIITRACMWHLSSHGHVRDIYHPTGTFVTSIIPRARMWHLSSHGHVRDIYHPTGIYLWQQEICCCMEQSTQSVTTSALDNSNYKSKHFYSRTTDHSSGDCLLICTWEMLLLTDLHNSTWNCTEEYLIVMYWIIPECPPTCSTISKGFARQT